MLLFSFSFRLIHNKDLASIRLGDQDKPWAPHKLYSERVNGLRQCFSSIKKHLCFGIPRHIVLKKQRTTVMTEVLFLLCVGLTFYKTLRRLGIQT